MGTRRGQIVNLFAPKDWQDDAVIIGNKLGLLDLRQAIDDALQNGRSTCRLMTSDTGLYDCTVVLNDEDLEQPFWTKMKEPYAQLIDDSSDTLDPEAYAAYGLSKSDDISDVQQAIERNKQLTRNFKDFK